MSKINSTKIIKHLHRI